MRSARDLAFLKTRYGALPGAFHGFCSLAVLIWTPPTRNEATECCETGGGRDGSGEEILLRRESGCGTMVGRAISK